MEYIHILPRNRDEHNSMGGPGDCPCEPTVEYLKDSDGDRMFDVRVLVHRGVRKQQINYEMKMFSDYYESYGGFNA